MARSEAPENADLGGRYRAIQELEKMGLFAEGKYLLDRIPNPDGTYRVFQVRSVLVPWSREFSIARPMPDVDVVALDLIHVSIHTDKHGKATTSYEGTRAGVSNPITVLQRLKTPEEAWEIISEDTLKTLSLKTVVTQEEDDREESWGRSS